MRTCDELACTWAAFTDGHVETEKSSPARTAVAWAVGIGLLLVAVVSLTCAIFYAWIEVATPGHAPLNHGMAVISKWAVPACIAGALLIPRLILRKHVRGSQPYHPPR
jgi:hypothetical protein